MKDKKQKERSKSKDRSSSKNRSTSKDKVDESGVAVGVVLSNDEIDDLIKDITLKKPGSAYSCFISEKYHMEKKKDKDVSMIDVNKKYAEVWKKMEEKDRKPYVEEYDRRKKKYDYEIQLLNHIFINDYDTKGATAYRLFLNQRIKEGFLREEDEEETKKNAREEWHNMSKVSLFIFNFSF